MSNIINNINNINILNNIISKQKINRNTLLHGSNSASLLAFTSYNNYEGNLLCTGELIKRNRLPFSGELLWGIQNGAINQKYLSTIPLGISKKGFYKALEYSKLKNINNKNTNYKESIQKLITNIENKSAKLSNLKNINERVKIISSSKKIDILKNRLKIYDSLNNIERSIIELSFPVIFLLIRMKDIKLN